MSQFDPTPEQPYRLKPSTLPVDNATEPFWLSERSRLDRHRTTEQLPSTADLVIIGSGLSGALLAYNLLKKDPKLKIVMLEAREVCSGASARNGGQVKTDPYITYIPRKAKYGAKLANELAKFETDHLAKYEKLIAEEQIDCAFHVTSAFDVCLTEGVANVARESYRERLADWPEDTKEFRELDDPEELQRLSQVKDGVWGCMYRVASIWPYKLGTALLEKCFQRSSSFNLQTTTPVTSIDSAPGRHVIHTARGDITAPRVAICTNGYTSSIVPELTEKVIPIRGTASSQLPPRPQLPNTPSSQVFRPLFTSYAFKYGGGRGEYMISRQEGKKEIIIGGAKEVYLHDPALWYGNTDDSERIHGAYEHFKGYMPAHFVNWPDATGNIDRVWTGILGYSSDKYPWVGQIPFKPEGLYIMAGFHGHGMCRIPGTAHALSELILSGAQGQAGFNVMSEAGLPTPYHFTQERYEAPVNEIFASMGYTSAPKLEKADV